MNEHGLRHFLCDERGFSPDRVDLAVKRMNAFYRRERSTLAGWLGKAGA
jgi:hypothetical protein